MHVSKLYSMSKMYHGSLFDTLQNRLPTLDLVLQDMFPESDATPFAEKVFRWVIVRLR